MNRIAVYTAIFGPRDTYKIPPNLGEGYAFFLFTDHPPRQVPPWVTVIPMRSPLPGDPVRSSKFIKIRPDVWLPGERITLWLDGSITLRNLEGLNRFVDTHDAAWFPHVARNCIYQEGYVCIARKKDNENLIANQMARYRSEGYPERNGLVEGGGILRRNTPAMIEFGKEWWNQVKHGSRRDQLSCNYALWKTTTSYEAFYDGHGGNVHHNKWWDVCLEEDRTPLPPPVPVPEAP